MNALPCLLLLTAVMMARSEELADFLNVRPFNEHIYIFEVTYTAGVGDLKRALDNFTIDYSFKVISESRYLFVIESNDTVALRHLTFPLDSEVTQYPVERASEYLEMFDVDPSIQADFDDHHSPNDVLLFLDWVLDMPKSVCPRTFSMEIVEFSEQFKEQIGILKPMIFPVLVAYPPRIFMFLKMDPNAIQLTVKEMLTIFGGYGSNKVEIKRIVRN